MTSIDVDNREWLVMVCVACEGDMAILKSVTAIDTVSGDDLLHILVLLYSYKHSYYYYYY